MLKRVKALLDVLGTLLLITAAGALLWRLSSHTDTTPSAPPLADVAGYKMNDSALPHRLV